VAGRRIHHMDLYRLSDPEELEFIGIRELDDPALLLLIEWPERGRGMLPATDLDVHLSHQAPGRLVEIQAHSTRGHAILARLASRPL